MSEIDVFLKKLLGSFKRRTLPVNGKYMYNTSYSLPMINYPTIDIVIISPFLYDVNRNDYIKNEDDSFYFFLYDNETDIIIGDIVNIHCDWDWKDELIFYSLTAEERLSENECPECGFWLIQKTNKYNHHFLGCSGYPDCEFSKEISSF